MRFPKECRILESASDDATRLSLSGPHYDAVAGTLTATDGKILVSLKVEVDEGDVSGIIPPEAIKDAVKLAKSPEWKRTPLTVLTAGKTAKLLDGRTYPLIDMQFPNWVLVLPRLDPARQRVVRLTIDPALLYSLALAAGHDGDAGVALLEFSTDCEDDAQAAPIRVTTGNKDALVHGVIMPVSMKSRAPNRIDDIEKAHAEYGNAEKPGVIK